MLLLRNENSVILKFNEVNISSFGKFLNLMEKNNILLFLKFLRTSFPLFIMILLKKIYIGINKHGRELEVM